MQKPILTFTQFATDFLKNVSKDWWNKLCEMMIKWPLAVKAFARVMWKSELALSVLCVMCAYLWFRVQIAVSSAEWGSHTSIFHSQLHHHAYEEQQTSGKQRECSHQCIITDSNHHVCPSRCRKRQRCTLYKGKLWSRVSCPEDQKEPDGSQTMTDFLSM